MIQIQLLSDFRANQSIANQIPTLLQEENQQIFFGPYQILELIGEGSFAKVYKAFHIIQEKYVALKVIDFQEVQSQYLSESTKKKFKLSLTTEEIHMKKCHSAHVIKHYDSFQNSNSKIFVLEYCQQGSLENYLAIHGKIEQQEAISILKQIICGLAELHRNGIIHRDLKPANILIHDSVFKIADLGFSKQIMNEQSIGRHTCLGTKSTMAPQVLKQEAYGVKSDIWSIGIIFYLMLEYDKSASYIQNIKKMQKLIDQKQALKKRLLLLEGVNFETKDFLRKILERNQSQRLDWEQTLSHGMFCRKVEKLPDFFLPQFQPQFQSLKKLKPFNFRQTAQTKTEINFSKIKEELDNFNFLNKQYLQCKKAEFIFNRIIFPLQEQKITDLQNHYHLELLYLLTARCKNNIVWATNQIKHRYAGKIYHAFVKQVSTLHQRVKLKLEHLSELLKLYEKKISTAIKHKIVKVVNNNKLQEREKFLKGLEGLDFTKTEQINFTCNAYLPAFISKLKNSRQEDTKNILSLLEVYKQIVLIGEPEELIQTRLQDAIQKLLICQL